MDAKLVCDMGTNVTLLKHSRPLVVSNDTSDLHNTATLARVMPVG